MRALPHTAVRARATRAAAEHQVFIDRIAFSIHDVTVAAWAPADNVNS